MVMMVLEFNRSSGIPDILYNEEQTADFLGVSSEFVKEHGKSLMPLPEIKNNTIWYRKSDLIKIADDVKKKASICD